MCCNLLLRFLHLGSMSHSELFSLYAGARMYADTLQASLIHFTKPEGGDLIAELRYHALTIHLNTQLEAARQVQTGWEQMPQLQEEITGLLAPLSAAIIHHARLSTRTDYRSAVEHAVESTYADPEHDTALSALDRQTLIRVALERGCAKEDYVQAAALPEQSSASEITMPTVVSAEPESPVSAAPTVSSIFRQLSIVPNKPTDELSLGVTLIARGILTREQWHNLPPGFARAVLSYKGDSIPEADPEPSPKQSHDTMNLAAHEVLFAPAQEPIPDEIVSAAESPTVTPPPVADPPPTMHPAPAPVATEPTPGPKLISILEPVTKRPRRPARPATAPPPVRVAASTPMRRQGPSFHEIVRRDRVDYMEEAPDIVQSVLEHLSQSNGHADAHLLTTLYTHAGDDLERREFFMLLQQMEEAGMIVRSRIGTDGPYVAHLVTQAE